MERGLISKTNFLDYPISNLSKSEILQAISEIALKNGVFFITVMNTNKMYLYDKKPLCRTSIDESFIILPENAINIGMKILRKPLKEWDVGGADIAKELLYNSSLKIFLLGATQEVQNIIFNKTDFRCTIVGGRNGYFRNEELHEISTQINQANPDVVLIAMGSPRQEELMQYFKHSLKKAILMGVGGTFDVIVGKKKDAPKWTRRGMEWFIDPSRIQKSLNVT
ncbi:MAG: glycosyltransferase [Ignavibacteriales bacterium]|nr:MAG: glycosyltransferase [Ignavibacteriales bacterium]